MSQSTQRSKNNPKLVTSLYKMKLRNVAVVCEFCKYVHTSTDEIKRLKAITHESVCDCDWANDPCCFRSTDPNFESNYIDSVLWINPHAIVCSTCADCLGNVTARAFRDHIFETFYRRTAKKLL